MTFAPVLSFLLGASNIGHSEPIAPETVWLFANMTASKCEARINEGAICSTEILNGENVSIVLDDCFFQNEIETCSGWRELEYPLDGIPFSASIHVEKRTEILNTPTYSMTVSVDVPRSSGVAPGYVTITPSAGGTLTDSLQIRGNTFWANDINFYIPYLTIGPVKPNLVDDKRYCRKLWIMPERLTL